jgi:hypothetical protein
MRKSRFAVQGQLKVLERKAFLASKYLARNLRPSTAGKEGKRMVFVAGHQRSGTNMLMDVLERSYETHLYHERNPRAFDNYQMRDLSVIRTLYERSKSDCFVIKALCESQDLPELMDAFPPARAIWMVRDYGDVVNSLVRSFPDFAKWAHCLANDPPAAGWRSKGMSPETRGIVRSVVRPEMTEPSAAALQWYVRNVLFFERGLDRDPRVLPVAYEVLVCRPQEEFPRIFDFMGIRYEPWMSKEVFADSVGKNNAPAIDPPIRTLCDGLMGRFRNLYPPES